MRARTHISIPVSDVKQSAAFYSKVFKTEPTKLKEDYANFRLESPIALHLSLVQYPELSKRTAESLNGQHFGVELFDDKDLLAWKDHVKSNGIAPHLEEEQATCCYAVADKFWLEDPDGHSWEFWVRTDDDGATLQSCNDAMPCCVPTQKEASCCG
jgi:catechol 2,3-dioxygenase-like lactoylglutathione lyase family enzyme